MPTDTKSLQPKPPTDATRWLLERFSAILQIIMVALMIWAGKSIIDLKEQGVAFNVKQDRVLSDLKEVKEEVTGLGKDVLRLKLIEEKELHEYNHHR